MPRHALAQTELEAFAKGFFARDFSNLERLLGAFGNTGIEQRQLARPLDWYRHPHDFPDKNEVYRQVALDLSVRASTQALQRSAVARTEVGAVVFVSSTGVSTPSLDSFLIQMLDLPRSVARVPLWGLGCAGGAAGLARAAELCRAMRCPVLLVAVEVCSATFMYEDRSKSNLIATALFGDGAAAVVLEPGSGHDFDGVEVLSGHSHLLDDSEDVMGWQLRPTGLQVRFARSIPGIVRRVVPDFVQRIAITQRVSAADLRELVLHPGGAKVLGAYEEALGVDPSALAHSREVLREHGNMSSPTALFVLERFLRQPRRRGMLGLLLGLGPGFSAEAAVLRW